MSRASRRRHPTRRVPSGACEGGPRIRNQDHTLIDYLEQHPVPLADNSSDLPLSATAYLASTRTRLLVPLVVQRRLVGLLSLGEPVSGGAYSSDDLLFLSGLADHAATAVTIVQLTNLKLSVSGLGERCTGDGPG